MRHPPARLSFLVWGLAAAFYLFGFFQRVTPASIGSDLMRDFGLTATGLGNLSAFYYYAYAAVQIPTGVLVDRLGPSRLFFFGSALSGIGALLFSLADSTAVAAAGRALIGASHGIAWVSMLKLVTHWFAPARFGTLSGLSLAVGTLGAVLAGPPLRWLADQFGWRSVIAVSGGLAIALALVIKWLMRDDPLDRRYLTHAPPTAHAQVRRAMHASADTWATVGRGLLEIGRYRNTWLLPVVNSGICGAFLTFTGLWGVPFFVQHHGLSVKQGAAITSGMLVLFALGGPLFGHWSDRWRRRKLPFAIGASAVVSAFVLLAVAPKTPLPISVPLLLLCGLGAGAMALSFGYAKESVPAHLQGTVTGVANMGVMTGTLVQMPVIGLILDAYWKGAALNGVRQYDLQAFQVAWMFLAAWVATAFLLLLLTRETHATQQ